MINSNLMPTVGEIARRLGVPIHRIEYVIHSRRIRPQSRAGNARVFSEAAVSRIASELRRIDAEKGAITYPTATPDGNDVLCRRRILN